MLANHQVPVSIAVSKNTATKSLVSKILGMSIQIGILYAGTKLAEYAWRFWGAC